MVKICPDCETKNFDDARHCTNCSKSLKRVPSQHVEVPEEMRSYPGDELEGLRPRGHTPEPWEGRWFSKVGLVFAALFCIFLFIYPLYLLLFIFSITVLILGRVGMKKGDVLVGKFVFILGVILFVVTVILFGIDLIHRL